MDPPAAPAAEVGPACRKAGCTINRQILQTRSLLRQSRADGNLRLLTDSLKRNTIGRLIRPEPIGKSALFDGPFWGIKIPSDWSVRTFWLARYRKRSKEDEQMQENRRNFM